MDIFKKIIGLFRKNRNLKKYSNDNVLHLSKNFRKINLDHLNGYDYLSGFPCREYEVFKDEDVQKELSSYPDTNAERHKVIETMRRPLAELYNTQYAINILKEEKFKALNNIIETMLDLVEATDFLKKFVDVDIRLFGGAPRDLLLGGEIRDLDVVITIKEPENRHYIKAKNHLNSVREFLLNEGLIKKDDQLNWYNTKTKTLLLMAAIKRSKKFREINHQRFKQEPKGSYDVLNYNDLIESIIKIEHQHYPVDIVLLNNNRIDHQVESFINRNDFSLCKINLKVDKTLNINNLMENIQIDTSFLLSHYFRRNILDTTFLNNENIIHSFKNRMPKLKSKYPEMPVEILLYKLDKDYNEKKTLIEKLMMDNILQKPGVQKSNKI